MRISLAYRRLNAFCAMCIALLLTANMIFAEGSPHISSLSSGTWPARFGESLVDVKVRSNYAYVALDPGGLGIIDVSNPTNCQLIASCKVPGRARGLAVSDGYAYLAAEAGGLQIVAITNPFAPILVGSCSNALNGTAVDVEVSGGYAYVADIGAGLQVIAITNPAAPVSVGNYLAESSAQALAVDDGHVYVINPYGLRVCSLSNPAIPEAVGWLYTGQQHTWDIAVSAGYAYLPGAYVDLRIVAVTNPAAPATVTTVEGTFGRVTVADGYAYVAGDLGVTVLAVTNPATPVKVGSENRSGSGRIAAGNGYLYMAANYAGLHAIAVSNPSLPIRVGGYGNGGTVAAMEISANHAYIAVNNSGLQTLSLDNPTFPVRVGGLASGPSAWDMCLAKGHAFIAAGSAGLEIVSITNPAAPAWVASCTNSIGGYALGVKVANDHAFVAATAGLHVISVTNPAAPLLVGIVTNLVSYRYPRDVAVSGDYAYVVMEGPGLHVLAITNPAAPVLVGVCTNYQFQSAHRIELSGDYAYVVGSGLHAFVLTNPAAPLWVGRYRSEYSADDVALSGTYAYLADRHISVLTLTNPALPRLIATIPNPLYAGSAKRVACAKNRIYLTEGSFGVHAFCTIPALQYGLQVDGGTLGLPFTIEFASTLSGAPIAWTPLYTTNPPALPFEFIDADSSQRQRYYRARQP